MAWAPCKTPRFSPKARCDASGGPRRARQMATDHAIERETSATPKRAEKEQKQKVLLPTEDGSGPGRGAVRGLRKQSRPGRVMLPGPAGGHASRAAAGQGRTRDGAGKEVYS